MWIFSTRGFYSVVQHREAAHLVLVRARVKEHLERLQTDFPKQLGDCEIVVMKDADYRVRLTVPREAWAEVVRELTMQIDYDNYKSACGRCSKTETDAEYVHCLNSVWSVMARLQWQTDEPSAKS
jgi:hypothetical protein